MDYVVSGSVWEYFNSPDCIMRSLTTSSVALSKRQSSPCQIAVVNEAYKVSEKDYQDTSAILNWNKTSHSLVAGSARKERMNEYKIHSRWALRTLLRAEHFGVKNY